MVLGAICVALVWVTPAEDKLKVAGYSFLLLSALLVSFVVVYVYLMLKNPDALRTENYSIQKSLIEKGLVGTQETGLVESDLSTLEDEIAMLGEGEDE